MVGGGRRKKGREGNSLTKNVLKACNNMRSKVKKEGS